MTGRKLKEKTRRRRTSESASIIRYLFMAIGIGLLVVAGFLYYNTTTFLAEAAKAEGTVMDLVLSRSDDSTTYRPLIHFQDQQGETIEFMSSVGSNPPSYSEGDKVEVLYIPSKPQNARVNGWFSLWGAATIVGSLGVVFFLIGCGITLVGVLKTRSEEYLRAYGKPIETEFQSVEQNTLVRVNGRYPFRIVSQWQNPVTSEIHVFRSNDLWFDPTDYIRDRPIRVFIERTNPRKYLVDLSFLPKLAE
jgi:hypothetical protein